MDLECFRLFAQNSKLSNNSAASCVQIKTYVDVVGIILVLQIILFGVGNFFNVVPQRLHFHDGCFFLVSDMLALLLGVKSDFRLFPVSPEKSILKLIQVYLETFQFSLETFQLVWKPSNWSGKFPETSSQF